MLSTEAFRLSLLAMEAAYPSTERGLQEALFARRDRHPVEVEVLRLEDLLRPPHSEKTTRPTRSHFHTLLIIDHGDSSHDVDWERRCIGPGDVLTIPAGHVQQFDEARVIAGYMVLFTTAFLERNTLALKGLTEAAGVLLRTAMHAHLSDASLESVNRVIEILADHSNPVGGRLFAEEATHSAFALLTFTLAGLPEISAAVAAAAPQDGLVAAFLERLETHFRIAHQAGTYADALHVSLRTLDRRLVAARGLTTRQAISARLVLEAKRMLVERHLSIKNIAYELGFTEPQNFTRLFRTQTGIKPLDFRNAVGAWGSK